MGSKLRPRPESVAKGSKPLIAALPSSRLRSQHATSCHMDPRDRERGGDDATQTGRRALGVGLKAFLKAARASSDTTSASHTSCRRHSRAEACEGTSACE